MRGEDWSTSPGSTEKKRFHFAAKVTIKPRLAKPYQYQSQNPSVVESFEKADDKKLHPLIFSVSHR